MQISSFLPTTASLHTSVIDSAARKGTRARREAIKKANKKKKIEEEISKEWIPFSERNKELVNCRNLVY